MDRWFYLMSSFSIIDNTQRIQDIFFNNVNKVCTIIILPKWGISNFLSGSPTFPDRSISLRLELNVILMKQNITCFPVMTTHAIFSYNSILLIIIFNLVNFILIINHNQICITDKKNGFSKRSQLFLTVSK